MRQTARNVTVSSTEAGAVGRLCAIGPNGSCFTQHREAGAHVFNDLVASGDGIECALLDRLGEEEDALHAVVAERDFSAMEVVGLTAGVDPGVGHDRSPRGRN